MGGKVRRRASAPAPMPTDGARAGTGRRTASRLAAVLLIAALLAGVAWWVMRPASHTGQPAHDKAVAVAADFVGSARCAECHAAQHAAWAKSQHAHAMQVADAATVRGNFDNATHTKDGVTSTFTRRDGTFLVRTDGPDGKLADFEVRYTFGLEPLQQYLVELPGGRLQALSLTWDTRPPGSGAYGWFRQYPDEKLDFRDELHWTQRSQNWNGMCADCHSTNVRKGYDAATDSFATQWSEISVGCEACHGPGSAHIAWSKDRRGDDATRGLTVALDERRGAVWQIDPATGNARRTPERRSGREIEVCGPCHARRAQLAEGWRAGAPFMDHYLPSRLADGLYHPDGQQRDEVFIWGSFVQSRMHRAGVTCGDCHDPHTQKLRAPGNAVCGQCHLASKYDAASHHFHPPGTTGAQCANCHMPTTTYMVVDPRRDHSLRVPRPDLSVKLGTPNACSQCHRESTAQWAAEQVARWYGAQRRSEPHYGETIDAGRRAQPGAARGLAAIATSIAYPPIVRATAVDLLGRYPGAASDDAIRNALRDADPLVRHAAVVALRAASASQVVAQLGPLLADPVRAVRIEAARRIGPYGAPLDPTSKAAFERAIAEYEAVQKTHLDRPEAWMNLGNLRAARGDAAGAEAAYREALKRDARFVPAHVNLADLRREQQRDADAEAVLRSALRTIPNAPALHEALGLALVRQGRKAEALAEFAAAAKAAPREARYAYLQAVALHDAGRRPEALRVLSEAARKIGDRDVLLALAAYRREAGDERGAAEALQALAAINADDPALERSR